MTIRLSATTTARLQLVALKSPALLRLTVDHPATRLVEYYTCSADALSRWVELQRVLNGLIPSSHEEFHSGNNEGRSKARSLTPA